MKKSNLYKTGTLCLAFLGAGTFMAFDDAQTDEQKIEAAYEQLVTDFNLEQDLLCKTQALAVAQDQFAQMKANAGSAQGANDVPSTGGNSSQGSNTATPAPTPAPTTGKDSKMSGGSSATAVDKDSKMSSGNKSGTTSTDKKKNKMNGK